MLAISWHFLSFQYLTVNLLFSLLGFKEGERGDFGSDCSSFGSSLTLMHTSAKHVHEKYTPLNPTFM